MKNRGLLTYAAKELGCSRGTILNYCGRYEEVEKARSDAKEATDDLAERGLFAGLSSAEEWAIKYYLSRKGRERGYADHQEHKVESDIPVRVVVDLIPYEDLGLERPKEEGDEP